MKTAPSSPTPVWVSVRRQPSRLRAAVKSRPGCRPGGARCARGLRRAIRQGNGLPADGRSRASEQAAGGRQLLSLCVSSLPDRATTQVRCFDRSRGRTRSASPSPTDGPDAVPPPRDTRDSSAALLRPRRFPAHRSQFPQPARPRETVPGRSTQPATCPEAGSRLPASGSRGRRSSPSAQTAGPCGRRAARWIRVRRRPLTSPACRNAGDPQFTLIARRLHLVLGDHQ